VTTITANVIGTDCCFCLPPRSYDLRRQGEIDESENRRVSGDDNGNHDLLPGTTVSRADVARVAASAFLYFFSLATSSRVVSLAWSAARALR
jgi:hypothetical protein